MRRRPTRPERGPTLRPAVPRRVRAAVALLAAVTLMAGCQTTAIVRLKVAPGGSGAVVVDVYLDHEAAAQVGDLSKIVRVDDLKRAGWKVIGPAPTRKVTAQVGSEAGSVPHGDGVQIHLEHAFADPAEANAILANLNGPDGPFEDVRIHRSSSLFSEKLHVSGRVDLHAGLDAFTDPALTRELGMSLGDLVAKSPGTHPRGDALQVELQVVPRSGQSWHGELGDQSADHAAAAARTHLGGAAQSIDVTSSRTHWIAVIGVGVGVVVVLGALVLIGFAYRRRANRVESTLLEAPIGPLPEAAPPSSGTSESVGPPVESSGTVAPPPGPPDAETDDGTHEDPPGTV